MAAAFNQAGFTDTAIGNAPHTDHPESQVIYQSQNLKQQYQSLLDRLITVKAGNVSVDANQTVDVIVIIGKI